MPQSLDQRSSQLTATTNTELAGLLEHLDTLALSLPEPITRPEDLEPIAAAVPKDLLQEDIDALPARQMLFSLKHWQVYFGTRQQLPNVLREITRLRELTFREVQEGSGKAVDSDRFDATYTQLFAWDSVERRIVGGYRLGHADQLRQAQGDEGVYLSAMFDFDDAFFDESPILEIGRSFVVPDFQRQPQSLNLLWCGIGRYLAMNPRYRRLYGVVSMSRLYDPRTSAAIRDALVRPVATVEPRAAYLTDLGGTWRRFLDARSALSLRDVSTIVRALEHENRDVPVLIRHYHKLGARFVSAAVDASFNNTPGLLLCLDVPGIPEKYLRRYLGDGAEVYLSYVRS